MLKRLSPKHYLQKRTSVHSRLQARPAQAQEWNPVRTRPGSKTLVRVGDRCRWPGPDSLSLSDASPPPPRTLADPHCLTSGQHPGAELWVGGEWGSGVTPFIAAAPANHRTELGSLS